MTTVAVSIDGMKHDPDIDVAVDRWLAVLDRARPIEHCEISLRVESGLFGLAKKLHVALVVAGRSAAATVDHTTKLKGKPQLYAAISEAFREAHLKLRELSPRPRRAGSIGGAVGTVPPEEVPAIARTSTDRFARGSNPEIAPETLGGEHEDVSHIVAAVPADHAAS